MKRPLLNARQLMWARSALGIGVIGAVVGIAANFNVFAQSSDCSPVSGSPTTGSPASCSPTTSSPTTTSPSTPVTIPGGPTTTPTTTTSSSSTPLPANTVVVTSAGGSIALSFGGTVSVPAGVVPPGVSLDITVSQTPPVPVPSSSKLAGDVVTITTSATKLNKPVTLYLSASSSVLSELQAAETASSTSSSTALTPAELLSRFAVFVDGQWQFVGSNINPATDQISVSVTKPGTYAVFANTQQFPDLNAAPWAVADENVLIGTGAISGFPNGDFEPNATATRAQVAKIITEIYDLAPATPTFSDVPANAWYAPYVGAVENAGIMNGVGNNQFDPNGVVTRAQFATLMARAMNLPPDVQASQLEFVDGSTAPTWAQGGIGALARVGILRGFPGDLLEANSQLTRAELAALVVRSLRFQGIVGAATGA